MNTKTVLNTLLFVYVYLKEIIDDPLKGYDVLHKVVYRDMAPRKVQREAGWYLVARLQETQIEPLEKLKETYKKCPIKIVKRLVAIPFSYYSGDLDKGRPTIEQIREAFNIG